MAVQGGEWMDEKRRKSKQRYREEHRAELAAYSRARYWNGGGKEYLQQYQREHREAVCANTNRYRDKHREEINARRRAAYKARKEK